MLAHGEPIDFVSQERWTYRQKGGCHVQQLSALGENTTTLGVWRRLGGLKFQSLAQKTRGSRGLCMFPHFRSSNVCSRRLRCCMRPNASADAVRRTQLDSGPLRPAVAERLRPPFWDTLGDIEDAARVHVHVAAHCMQYVSCSTCARATLKYRLAGGAPSISLWGRGISQCIQADRAERTRLSLQGGRYRSALAVQTLLRCVCLVSLGCAVTCLCGAMAPASSCGLQTAACDWLRGGAEAKTRAVEVKTAGGSVETRWLFTDSLRVVV